MMEKSLAQWEQIQQVLIQIDQIDREYIENVVYDYMITQIYAEMEETIESCFKFYLTSNNLLTNNYLKQQKKIHRGLGISNLTEVFHALQILDKGETFISPDIQDIHDKFLNIRHKLTHTAHTERSTDIKINVIIDNCSKILDKILQLFTDFHAQQFDSQIQNLESR